MKSKSIEAARAAVVLIAMLFGAPEVETDDWRMFGRDQTRNAVSPEKNAPTEWHIKGMAKSFDEEGKVVERFAQSKNVKWSVKLGTNTLGDPVIADGLVWVGTNEYTNREHDASVLMCFRESDGELLYKYVSPRLPLRANDWPASSFACSPLIEGDRMWFATNRCETVCLDIGPLQRGEGEPKLLWKVDMMKELGVFPIGTVMANVRFASVASYKDFIYVITGNGFQWNRNRPSLVPSPRAPSLVCFEKHTGKLIWFDRSPGRNILFGQWASPLVMEINGRGQVIAPQGDGWIRSFDAITGELIWKFDTNPKNAKRRLGGRGDRNSILATPVFYKNRIYIGNGQHPGHGYAVGWLYCLDPTKRGDISAELAVNAEGDVIPHWREQAVDPLKESLLTRICG